MTFYTLHLLLIKHRQRSWILQRGKSKELQREAEALRGPEGSRFMPISLQSFAQLEIHLQTLS